MNATLAPSHDPRSAARRVLLCGHAPKDPSSLQRDLAEVGLRAEIQAADSADALAALLDARAGDVVLAYLGDAAAVRALADRARAHDPFARIVVAFTGGAPPVAALMRAGARDAVPAADEAHLAAVIEREAAGAERARAAETLATRVRRLEDIIDHVPVMLFSKEASTLQIELWNKTAQELTGVPEAAVMGKTDRDLFPEQADLYNKVDREVLANKVPVGAEEPISTPRGERWLYTSKVPLLDENGEPVSLLAISLDITDRRNTELALIESHKKLAESESGKQELIERLRYSIDELSNPILEVWDDVLAMPIIGVVDSRRTADMVQRLLGEVARTQASFVIIDLTGVEIVDTKTADHLMKLMRKVEIVGARCVLTGIRPAVAETLVDIGMDFGKLTMLRNLKHGLREALRAGRRDRSGSDVDSAEIAEDAGREKRRSR
ncbi:RsbR, positive regulator of sigma-B [Minicystis rosea]|nr:RsbR, positive regulator of sigma-B [Minicystis rosea]